MNYKLISLFAVTMFASVVFWFTVYFFCFDRRPVRHIYTADEYLENLESRDLSYRYKYHLNDDEVAKMATVLRERYPFESLSERLKMSEADLANEKERDQKRHYNPTVRSVSLRDLHRDNVARFIMLPGQGVRRGLQGDPYGLVMKKHLERLDPIRIPPSVLNEPEVRLTQPAQATDVNGNRQAIDTRGIPDKHSVSQFHDMTEEGFALRFSFGHYDSITRVAGFESHRVRFDQSWDGSLRTAGGDVVPVEAQTWRGKLVEWKTNRIELVGLLLSDKPRVYVSENLPNMDELNGANAIARKLNGFEQESLAKLRDNEGLVTRATPNRIEMLGAIHANKECLQCHSVEEGALLGAFSYEFLRTPLADISSFDFELDD